MDPHAEIARLKAEVEALRAAVRATQTVSTIGSALGGRLAAPGSEELQLRTDRAGRVLRWIDARLAGLLGVEAECVVDGPLEAVDRLPGAPGFLRQLLDEALAQPARTCARAHDLPGPTPAEARHLVLRATATPSGCVLVVSDDTRRRRLETVVGRYASPTLLESLVQHPGDFFALRRVEATLLFCDLVNYSGSVARLTPEQVGRLLTAFFRVGILVVEAHRGMVVQFVGDELMVVFGAPLPDPAHAQHAARCALALQQAHETVRAAWRAQGLPELGIRIGVATGDALAGNLGDERRASWCVVGHPTNLAARMLAAAEPGQALAARGTVDAASLSLAEPALGAPPGPAPRFVPLAAPVVAKNLGTVEAFEIRPA